MCVMRSIERCTRASSMHWCGGAARNVRMHRQGERKRTTMAVGSFEVCVSTVDSCSFVLLLSLCLFFFSGCRSTPTSWHCASVRGRRCRADHDQGSLERGAVVDCCRIAAAVPL